MPFNRPIPDRKPQSKVAGGLNAVIQAETLMQIAFVLPSAAVIGWLAGAFADSRLHQSWIGVAGLIFGFISGMVYVIRLAMSAEKGSPPDTKAVDGAGKGSPKFKA
jgi:F0F1-type ATP synthase assembly protein I